MIPIQYLTGAALAAAFVLGCAYLVQLAAILAVKAQYPGIPL